MRSACSACVFRPLFLLMLLTTPPLAMTSAADAARPTAVAGPSAAPQERPRQRPSGTAQQGRKDVAAPSQRSRERGGEKADAPAGRGDREGVGRLSDRGALDDLDLPQPNPAQQANLQQLRQDLSALTQGARNAEDEIRALARHLQGMALQPPDPALVQDLAEDLAAAMADSSLTPREIAQLTDAVYAVLNSAGLSQQEVQVLKDDVEAILAASGVGRAEIEAVLRDLQAIYEASAASGAPQSRGGAARGRRS